MKFGWNREARKSRLQRIFWIVFATTLLNINEETDF